MMVVALKWSITSAILMLLWCWEVCVPGCVLRVEFRGNSFKLARSQTLPAPFAQKQHDAVRQLLHA